MRQFGVLPELPPGWHIASLGQVIFKGEWHWRCFCESDDKLYSINQIYRTPEHAVEACRVHISEMAARPWRKAVELAKPILMHKKIKNSARKKYGWVLWRRKWLPFN